ncbi:MAG: PKD domain-containing protein [Kiritimatiellia bacterium]
MKMAGIKKLSSKLAFPLIMAATVFAGLSAMAQTDGDVVSISSDQSDSTITASGVDVNIRLTLDGYFEKISDGGSATGEPQLRVDVNGSLGWAEFDSVSRYTIAGGTISRTDINFIYTVQPGDMASPLSLYGFAGGSTPGGSFQFIWNGWQISLVGDSSTLVDWRYDTDSMVSGDLYDPDFSAANVVLQTLSFDDPNCPTSVAATETVSWRVTSVNPVESTVVSFRVWPVDPSIVQMGSGAEDYFEVNMPTGSTEADFAMRGLAAGTTDIYLQRTADFMNNTGNIGDPGYVAGATNYIRRTIEVTPPPEPTVRIIMTDNGSDNITMDESGVLSVGNFRVELSEPYSSDVYVAVDTSIAGIPQDSVTFASDPFIVRIAAGDTASPDSKFNVPDGNLLSTATGVTMTPTITNNTSAADYYMRVREATVYVNNIAPEITRPEDSDSFTVTRGMNQNFDFTVADVPADRSSIITRWNFGDSTPEQVYTGHVGQAFHTYATTGTFLATVQAEDKDGALSAQIEFTVDVQSPQPQPSVSITPASYVYPETTDNASGELSVSLSESFTEDVWIRLETVPELQDSIVLSTTNAFRISAGTTNRPSPFRFSLVDGTEFSELSGITLRPVVTNDAAAAYYTDLKETTVFVENVIPVIERPLASDLGAPADPTYGYDSVSMDIPFTFDYDVFDVPADLDSMVVTWNFGDGSILTVTGAVGSVSHTYNSLGDKNVSVQATDKDGGKSEKIEFKVTVVQPPPPPSVTVVGPAFELNETDDPMVDQIAVRLTEAFTNNVVVDLSINISDVLNLSTNRIIFGVGETNKIVYLSPVDGTSATRAPGVRVTPSVVGTAAAVSHFTTLNSGYVRIKNVAPEINNPTASDPNAEPTLTVAQGSPYPFSWSVSDVLADLPDMEVTWRWGDGTTDVVSGGSGSIEHTYDALGEMIVVCRAEDKDGASQEVSFKIRVLPSKTVMVTSIGPHGGYSSAPGIGNGTVSSAAARNWENFDNVYHFYYDPGIESAILTASPYKADYQVVTYDEDGNPTTSPVVNQKDSFFYVWTGEDQGLNPLALEPAEDLNTTYITLPEVSENDEGSSSSVEIRQVAAVFSEELLPEDNLGDINSDYIPDDIAELYGLHLIDEDPNQRNDLENRASYNGDEDYLPIIHTESASIYAPIGVPFTAVTEVRGFDEQGLNYYYKGEYVSERVGELDEPGAELNRRGGTDPTKEDTDGDSFPDGWEYYFWYNAKIQGVTGERYNPDDVAQGTRITTNEIMTAFNPIVPAASSVGGSVSDRDFDNDGLLDVEELAAGTNPCHWDTDGDGMCDGWEVLRGLDPTDPLDGLDMTQNNPDGDYMAFATVTRQWTKVVLSSGETNFLLSANAVQGDTNGTFYTWYNYGDTNAPIALGRSVKLPAGAEVAELEDINVLIMHFQVRDEFGFDPRTAWTDYIDADRFSGTGAEGPAPNTQPFTSRDEYLLMKFMNEMGYVGEIASTAVAWTPVSTDPLTPDTDACTEGTDSIPDGWELYVATDEDPGNTDLRISPWNHLDGADDFDPSMKGGDGLSLQREYAGVYSSAKYAASELYASVRGYNTVSIVPYAADQYWVNKFWPTNPWDMDTDGDGVSDSVETAFIYGNPTDSGGLCTAGGGLNPCSKDTDRDALTDSWELQFYGTPTDAAGGGLEIVNGMDGTVQDHNEDWDNDGLLNYQEYWVQAVRSFRYDVSSDDCPMDDTYDVSYFFTEITDEWDVARYPWGMAEPASCLLLPAAGAVYVSFDTSTPTTHAGSPIYTSTDPRNEDTDSDGMDDYYEMYHGLNPILGMGEDGDIIADVYDPEPMTYYNNPFYSVALDALPMNFMLYPWLAGMPEADCDGDGLINFEEMLLANTAAAPNYNTDPTALWMTDYNNPNSHTHKFYFNGSMFFWPGTARNRTTMTMQYAAMFDFEMNEGYDTDNDGLSDKAELVHSRNTFSDPRNHDDPMRRQAIYFSGTNSVARTISSSAHEGWTFRSFTAEVWACPEKTDANQVILERTIPLIASDINDPTGARPRRTFQIGIVEDGRVYAMFDTAGSAYHDPHTAETAVFGPVLEAGKWVHITARMNGEEGQFDIIINGQLYRTIDTELIPATGTVTIDESPDGSEQTTYVCAGAIIAGASDNTPGVTVLTHEWDGFEKFFQGYVDEIRIWDGARELSDIDNDVYKRYVRSDIENNRRTVRTEEYWGASRVSGDIQLSPELMYHYTFDNIFGAEDADSIALAPRGFMHPAVTTNRPAAELNNALLFGDSPVTSTVYTNFEYLSIIENGVEHLPEFGDIAVVDSILDVQMSDTVPNSIFWSETLAGDTAGEYVFPNDNNPYGISYNFDQDDPVESSGLVIFGDMMPLGDAFAKTVPVMWDQQGPSAPWNETGIDTDFDGLPDWWEMDRYGSLDAGWDELYLDGSGMTNGERYLRDIAHGATPNNPTGIDGLVQIADLDGDGMPDWWENIFSLDPQSAVGNEGATGDPDRDGLPNLAEYLISEVYGFRYLSPRLFRTDQNQAFSDYYQKEGSMTYGGMFTDHDFVEDYWEDLYDPYYANSYVFDSHEDNDEDGWSNWSEARYASSFRNIDPDKISSTLTIDKNINEYPIPVIATEMRYNGFQIGGNIVIDAYTTPDMDGVPDAKYSFAYNADGTLQDSKTVAMGIWKPKTYSVTLTPGSLAPGSVSLTFTDKWTQETVSTGYDVDGIVYSTLVGGYYSAIGTIDYETGQIEIDLSQYEDSYIHGESWEEGVPYSEQSREAYLLPESCTVEVIYSYNLDNTWPKTLYLGKADDGVIREGLNYFFTYIDLNGSGSWNAGEPCGLPEQFATDIGWDYNEIAVELTDYREGYLRLDLASGLRSRDLILGLPGEEGPGGDIDGQTQTSVKRVRVSREVGTFQDIVLDRVITGDRNYLHEGDLFAQGELALDWNLAEDVLASSVSYSVYVGDEPLLEDNLLVTTFTNVYVSDIYEQDQDAAVTTKPVNGAYVYSSRPVFRWTMPDLYPAFALEIRKGSPTGPVVYESGPFKAPSRDASTGEYVWEAPIHAGDKLSSGHYFSVNTVYAWRVTTLNSRFSMDIPDGSYGSGATADGWSDWKFFRLDVNEPMQSSGYGMIDVTVKYFGPAQYLADHVKVQAYNTRDFTGVARAQYTLSSLELASLTDTSTTNVNAVLRGLTPSSYAGDYYVMAYIDTNNNNKRDEWESWGYANYYGRNVLIDDEDVVSGSIYKDLYGGAIAPYVAKPVEVKMSSIIPKATIMIEDADTDQDWFPDAWEYEQNPGGNFLEAIGPADGGTSMGDTEINPYLSPTMAGTLSLLVFGSTDYDADGLDDYTELILGTDATAADDGAVSDNIRIGLSPEDECELKVADVGFADNLAELTWDVNVDKADSSLSKGMLNLMSANPDGNVTYYVDYTPSLSNPQWSTVKQGTITLEGSQTLINQIGIDVESTSSGFFRVRLGN